MKHLDDKAPTSVRPERRDVAEGRRRILAAAQYLFANNNICAVTMEEIAQVAGVGKGTLYRKYAHKGALCLALLETYENQLQMEVEQYLDSAQPSASPFTLLSWFMDQLITFNEEHFTLLRAIRNQESGTRDFSMYHCPRYQWEYQVTLDLLKRSGEHSRHNDSLNEAEYLADALLAPLDIDLYLFQRNIRGYSPERIRAGVHSLLESIAMANAERKHPHCGEGASIRLR